jgi:phosphopantothenoylcysteine decarboxylase/phosphopantothenate--cysteine ligase
MIRKQCDAIVLNTLLTDGAGFGADTNEVVVLTQGGDSHTFGLKSKNLIASELVSFLVDALQNQRK